MYFVTFLYWQTWSYLEGVYKLYKYVMTLHSLLAKNTYVIVTSQPGLLSFLSFCSSVMSYSDDSRVYTALFPSSSHTRCQSDPHGAVLPVMSV